MTELAVHPVAALFPMLADDELEELAADIKERGLLQPIVLDSEGRILDGRNRLAACELAGVDPDFITYEGDDAHGYAYATNRRRRSLRVGAGYIIDEEFRRLKETNGEKITKIGYSGELGINHNRLYEAAAVLDYAKDLRGAVFDGQMSLQAAAELARERRKQDAENAANMLRLKNFAPDLHALVDINNMRLDEALGAYEVRVANDLADRRAAEEKARAEAEASVNEEKRKAHLHSVKLRECVDDGVRASTEIWQHFIANAGAILLAQRNMAEAVKILGDSVVPPPLMTKDRFSEIKKMMDLLKKEFDL